jgi:hypothetical protein
VQAVARWQAKLEAVEPDVQRVMAEEREETALRKAEMEANKAQVGEQGAGRIPCMSCMRAQGHAYMHACMAMRGPPWGCLGVQLCAVLPVWMSCEGLRVLVVLQLLLTPWLTAPLTFCFNTD